MPPKAASMTNEEFLSSCFKYCKEKPVVDFVALAENIGMSSGGAQNKFRALMKQFEEDGVSWAKKNDATTTAPGSPDEPPKKAAAAKRKAPARKATKAAAVDSDSADDALAKHEEAGDSGSEAAVEAPKKKAKAAPKKAAAKGAGKAKGKAKKKAATPEEDETPVKPEDEEMNDANAADGDEVIESIETKQEDDANEAQI